MSQALFPKDGRMHTATPQPPVTVAACLSLRLRRLRRLRVIATLSGIAALAIPIAVSGCDSRHDQNPTEKITLSIFWWGGPERADITGKVLNLYSKKHPNITFKTQWQANNGYYDKLAEMAAGGDAPDVFQLDDNALTDLATRNIALDLSRFIDADRPVIDETRLPDGLAQYGDVNGRPFGVPSSENTPAMFYDKTVLRSLGLVEPQIGWSYDQLLTWAAEITAKSGGKVYGTMDPSADYKALWLWLRAQGKELYNGTNLGFASEDLQRWLDYWARARQRRVTPPAEVIVAANTSDVNKQLVVNKLGATTFAWSNMLSEYQKGTDHELGITAYPGDPKGQWARASQYWSIYKGSKHSEVAADLINFLVNDLEAGKILGTERGLPANLDIRAQITSSLSTPMQATVVFENAMTTRFGPAPAPPIKGHSQIRALLVQAAESVQWGKATTQQAVAQFMVQAGPALGG